MSVSSPGTAEQPAMLAADLSGRTRWGSASGRTIWFLRLAVLGILAALLYWVLRDVPLGAILQAVGYLRPWQILVLLSLNGLIYALITARWWMVVRAEAPGVPYLPMVGVRLSVFAVSYLTVGPQIGGEPLQVLYLRHRHALSYTRATASVITDKLFELLGNFVLLSFGLVAIFHTGVLTAASNASRLTLALLGLLVAWPLVHIGLLYRGVYPISHLLRVFGNRFGRSRLVRFVRAAERLAGQFCQRHPRLMLGGLLVSLLAAAATVSEYALITSFLHVHLPFWQLVTAWTTGWLSFLVPVPGGLGSLEASQVTVLGAFGISVAAALSIVLVMRGRDLVFGGFGLLLAALAARRP